MLQNSLQTHALANDVLKPGLSIELLFEILSRLFASPEGFLCLPFFGEVSDDTQHHSALCRLNRTQHDVGGEFTAILASAIEFQAVAHRADASLIGIVFSVGGMRPAKSLGYQDVDRLA